MIELEWEPIKQNHAGFLSRAKVFGGWLIKEASDVQTQVVDFYNEHPSFRNEYGYEFRTTMTFMADPNHEWS